MVKESRELTCDKLSHLYVQVKAIINLVDDNNGCVDNQEEPIINPETDISSVTSEQEIVRCEGAYVSFTDYMSILLRKIRNVVKQVPGGGLDKALDKDFF